MLTRPVTEGTVNGVHENDDAIDEFGLYLQSETDFSEKFKLVLAGRLDNHNRQDAPFFSPRAGLVYALDPGNRLRFSFSRAFTTPTAQNLFLDRLTSPLIPDRLISFSEFVRFQPFNVRVRGVPEKGLTFRRDGSGGINGLYMQPVPLYFPESQNQALLPADATLLWDKVVEIITQIQGSGLDYAFRGLQTIPAPTAAEVASVLKLFNASTGDFSPVDPAVVSDIRGLESTKTTSFEIGYKSVAKSGLLLDVAVYYNRIKDFTGPLLLETPNVFFDRQSLQDFLIEQDALAPGAELDRRSAAQAFARMISQIPLGTVDPNESRYPGDLMLTYRNFGDVNLWGLDLDLAYTPSPYFTLDGNFSHVSKDFFQNERGVRDIALNAPQNKFSLGLQAKSPVTAVFFGMRFRHVDKFPVNSGVFVGTVPTYNIFDFNAGIDLPGETGIRLMLTVQ
ncbi:MAG: TonB-dependent receptor domain-containing protein, partial [bacterium]